MATDYAAAIADLEAALAGGERAIEADGEKVEYRSPAEILAQISYLRQAQAAASASTTRAPSAVTVAAFSRS